MTVYVTRTIVDMLESWDIRWNSGDRFTALSYGCVGTSIKVSIESLAIFRSWATDSDLCDERVFIAWFHNSFLPEAIISCHARRIPC